MSPSKNKTTKKRSKKAASVVTPRTKKRIIISSVVKGLSPSQTESIESQCQKMMGDAKRAQRADYIHEMALHGNGVEAMKAVGYTGVVPLKDVAPEVLQVRSTIAARCGITAERIMREYAAMGFSNMLDFTRKCGDGVVIDLSNIGRDQAAAIQEIVVEEYLERKEGTEDEYERVKRTKFKLYPKEIALDKMAKHLGIKGFDSKLQLVGKDDGPIQLQAVPMLSDAELERIASGHDIPGDTDDEADNSPNTIEQTTSTPE